MSNDLDIWKSTALKVHRLHPLVLLIRVINRKLSLENSWNDTEKEKLKYLVKSMSLHHFGHHKSGTD